MISIGNVASVAAGVAYYDEAVADSQVDYYAARGEAPGMWMGAAAPELGLAGRVERESLAAVLEGRDPRSGEELGRIYGSRKNVAFDVTYSVPKSLSLLYALGDDRVKESVLRALRAGAVTAHGYLERHAGWARVYDRAADRVHRVRAQLVTAAFVHRSARPVTRDGVTTVDPQLHTHLLVASFVRRANGTWGQLYSEPLYAHAAAAGALGQAATRDVLVRELGVRVRTLPNGTFEIDGFTAEQLAEFSQRHRQTVAAAAAMGASTLHGTKVAVLDTRESKSVLPPGADLLGEWRERAASLGLTPEGLAGLLDQEQVRELRTIAWTAHRLSTLHDAHDAKIFDKVVVITDRVVLDRQLQDTIYQFEHVRGVVEKIDQDSKQLAKALVGQQARIIITTLQKFPWILKQLAGMPKRRYAVIVDEAHSSQSGETAKELKLALGDTEEQELTVAEAEDAGFVATATDPVEEALAKALKARGRQPNISFFAFTATPKARTLEIFGTWNAEEKRFEPFHLYSMRQAIEEGFCRRPHSLSM